MFLLISQRENLISMKKELSSKFYLYFLIYKILLRHISKQNKTTNLPILYVIK